MGTFAETQARRLVGILERPLLGGAMRVALFVVERRLSRVKDRRDTNRRVGS